MQGRVKPRLRGLSHEWAAYLAAFAGIILALLAPTGRAMWAAGIYCLTLVGLLGMSAVYHRPTWTPGTRAILRRLDHAAIFLLVAGTYTPIALLVLEDRNGAFLLRLVWAGAGLGVAQSLLWPRAPRILVVLLPLALGWTALWEWTTLMGLLRSELVLLLLAGGLVYTLGAIVYWARTPDPWPEVFGYHEIFHALVVLAIVLHFAAIAQIVFEFAA